MFEGLIGNEDVKEILRRLRKSGRVPNALLFAGDEGVGKRSFALELARSFLCEIEDVTVVCGVCGACRRSAALNMPTSDKKEDYERVHLSDHADLGMIVPHNKNILVDAIRNLEQEAFFRPFEAPARFFIIDDAHKMNDAASNALLKTLEEPSSTTHIFLVTSHPSSLLQTIRSRCQVIRFAPLSAAEIESHLVAEKIFKPADARLVARLADGSIGRAITFDIEGFRTRRDLILRVIESAILRRDGVTLLKAAEEINAPENKEFYEEYLGALQILTRDLWLLGIGRSERISNLDIAETLAGWAPSIGTAVLAGWIAEIEALRLNLSVNVNRKIATDALFMKMTGI